MGNVLSRVEVQGYAEVDAIRREGLGVALADDDGCRGALSIRRSSRGGGGSPFKSITRVDCMHVMVTRPDVDGRPIRTDGG